MVVEPEIFDFLESVTIIRVDVLEKLQKKKTVCIQTSKIWQCMDALRDKHLWIFMERQKLIGKFQ